MEVILATVLADLIVFPLIYWLGWRAGRRSLHQWRNT